MNYVRSRDFSKQSHGARAIMFSQQVGGARGSFFKNIRGILRDPKYKKAFMSALGNTYKNEIAPIAKSLLTDTIGKDSADALEMLGKDIIKVHKSRKAAAKEVNKTPVSLAGPAPPSPMDIVPAKPFGGAGRKKHAGKRTGKILADELRAMGLC